MADSRRPDSAAHDERDAPRRHPARSAGVRRATRRSLGWPARTLISVSIPLAIGLLLANTGLPRWAYNNARYFWALAGLHDLTPVRVPARPAHERPRPLTPRLRYITEGAIYAVMIIPAFVLAIFIYDRLTFRYHRDLHLRCPDCNHILQGLTEPRCPECGRRI